MQEQVNVLLLSDIHYTNKGTAKNTLKGLIGKCKELLQEEIIDIILIAGDLCDKGQYGESFISEFINGLISVDADIASKIIVVPGNHDVSAKEVDKIKSKPIGELSDDENNLLKLLFKKGGRMSAAEVFKELEHYNFEQVQNIGELYYLEYSKACAKLPLMYSGIKEKNQIQSKKHFFCGYKYFNELKLCIVYLNSSWVCIDRSGDYGNIIIGANVTGSIISEAREEIESYNMKVEDVLVVTVTHHPPSWWFHKETNSINTTYTANYEEIIKFSNVLITGHTHSTLQGYSIINYKLKDEHAPLEQVVFIESPACHLSNPEYPSCFSLLTIDRFEKRITKNNFVAQGSSAAQKFKFENKIDIELPSKTNIQTEELFKRKILYKNNYHSPNIADLLEYESCVDVPIDKLNILLSNQTCPDKKLIDIVNIYSDTEVYKSFNVVLFIKNTGHAFEKRFSKLIKDNIGIIRAEGDKMAILTIYYWGSYVSDSCVYTTDEIYSSYKKAICDNKLQNYESSISVDFLCASKWLFDKICI